MAVSNVSNDRNYLNLLGSAGKEPVEDLAKKYGIEYQTEDPGNLDYSDYLQLMITQLTNQDFTNPTDDAEYMAQMTQYSTLQAMQELAKYSQHNYAMSMIGQTVTASKYNNGKMIKETGPVELITRQDDEYQLTINGQTFTLKQIMSVGEGAATEDTENKEDNEENSAAGDQNTGTGVPVGDMDAVEQSLLEAAEAAMG
ncbi:MAG: flagellar hook capping FlgD N-terminal domain-containing protein [Oscillospiraceae bacterium]|nr:hypothetical protein [Oscillospiraceae bacterium]MDD6083155.1 flagellar hook capping FlgD N-terminal domain-containing protein [Oscillospiraceae bacterium]